MRIQFVVCPTPGCGSYFGSSGMGDMNEVVAKKGANFENRPSHRWHTRASCPDCRGRGISVERVLVNFNIDIPAEMLTVSEG
jgi:hypothetical protein